MWTSERNRSLPAGEAAAELGTAQGGTELRPGEVRLTGGNCSVYLSQSGLNLSGALYLNGRGLEEIVREIVASILK